MAPEVVKQSIYTKKADIWSVGCLIVEMLTGDHPWAQLSQMQAIYQARSISLVRFCRNTPTFFQQIGSSAKPTIPSDISSDAQSFLQLTFETNHEARPSAPELSQHSWIAQKPTKRTNLEVMI
jgi:mitogen-activated protein kinase kinase kinase